MLRSIGSGASSAVPRSGGSNSTSSPPVRRWLLPSALPSTRTPPASSRRSATPREPTSGKEARKRSSRSPAALSGTRCFTHAARPRGVAIGRYKGEQQRRADDDERVGEVESRPVAEVEKVGDVAEPDSVDEVGDAASDHEA